MVGDDVLALAVWETVRYADLFSMPLTLTQIWRCLVRVEGMDASSYHLADVRRVLRDSTLLREKLGTQDGYYFLSGRSDLVRERLTRHALAQQKWKILRRVARVLALAPFVEALAGSGSLAIDNTKPSSDLDLFVVARRHRIWTARLFLLLLAQVTGRRRKYWNIQAPDKVCLNHYVTDGQLLVQPEVRNMYTAVQYSLHVPVYGAEVMRDFAAANAEWIKDYVMASELPAVAHRYEITLNPVAGWLKRFLENWLLEPIGNVVEDFAEWLQRATIERHHSWATSGRVVLSDHELAFHPDTKVPGILAEFGKL